MVAMVTKTYTGSTKFLVTVDMPRFMSWIENKVHAQVEASFQQGQKATKDECPSKEELLHKRLT